MGLFFDRRFVAFLKIGDVDGAIALLIKQYPHLKNDKERQALYISKYKACYLDKKKYNIGTVTQQLRRDMKNLAINRDEHGFFGLNNTYGTYPNSRTVTIRLARDIEEAKKALDEQIKHWDVSEADRLELLEAINEDMPTAKAIPLLVNQNITTGRALNSPNYPPISSSLF